jgi:hypothetical protein
MSKRKIPKSYWLILGLIPFALGGSLLYITLTSVFYYGGISGINGLFSGHTPSGLLPVTSGIYGILTVYTLVSSVLLFTGLWMLVQEGKPNLSGYRFFSVPLEILGLSLGLLLLLTPLYAITIGPMPPSTYNGKFPVTSVNSYSLWGLTFIGAGVWLFVHSKKTANLKQ